MTDQPSAHAPDVCLRCGATIQSMGVDEWCGEVELRVPQR
jgi:hypothetical protein